MILSRLEAGGPEDHGSIPAAFAVSRQTTSSSPMRLAKASARTWRQT